MDFEPGTWRMVLFAGAVPEPSAEQAGLIASEIVGFVCLRGTLG